MSSEISSKISLVLFLGLPLNFISPSLAQAQSGNEPTFDDDVMVVNRTGCLGNVERALANPLLRSVAASQYQIQNRRRPRGEPPLAPLPRPGSLFTILPGRPRVLQLMVRGGIPEKNYKFQYRPDLDPPTLVVKDGNRVIVPTAPLPTTWDEAVSAALAARLAELTTLFNYALPRLRPNRALVNVMSIVIGVPTDYREHDMVPVTVADIALDSTNRAGVTTCNSGPHFYTVCDAAVEGGRIDSMSNEPDRRRIRMYVNPRSVPISCGLKGLAQVIRERSAFGSDFAYNFSLSSTPIPDPAGGNDGEGSYKGAGAE